MEIFSVLKYTFKTFYQDLFKLVLLGMLWFILTAILLFTVFFGLSTGWFIILLVPLFTLGPIFLTALFAVNQIIENKEYSLKRVFSYFKERFWRGFFVCFGTIIIYAVFIVDLRFFLIRGQENIWLLAFAFLFAYLIIYFSVYQAYLWSLLIIQDEKSLKEIMKNALILSLDNILFSLFWFLSILIFTFILAATGVGLPTLFLGLIGILILNGTRKMLAKY